MLLVLTPWALLERTEMKESKPTSPEPAHIHALDASSTYCGLDADAWITRLVNYPAEAICEECILALAAKIQANKEVNNEGHQKKEAD